MKSEIEAPSGTEPHTNGCVRTLAGAREGEEQRARAPLETAAAASRGRVHSLFSQPSEDSDPPQESAGFVLGASQRVVLSVITLCPEVTGGG